MTKHDYLEMLSTAKVDEGKVSKVQDVYGSAFPEMVQKIITLADNSIFFDDGYRILSIDEMIDAENDLHVKFKDNGILPVADCDENDFIVYHFEDDFWSKFNIVDETVFKKKNTFAELLK